jgi:hypothetical protein
MGMRATVRTVLDAPAERVWQEVRTIRLLRHVAGPILVFRPEAAMAAEFLGGCR